MARPRRPVLEYRNYELPADFPIMVLTGDQWHISPTPAKHLHFHNCLEIGICHAGSGMMVLEKQQVHFSAGDVTCIARNVPHTTWSDPGQQSLWSYLFLEPDALLGSSALGNYTTLPEARRFLTDCSLLLSLTEQPWAGTLVQELIRELTECAPGYQTSVRGLCTALLMNMLRVYGQQTVEQQRDPYMHVLSPAFSYIHDHYMQTFPQATLAEICHLSPTHFRRLFKEQTGISPLDFLHQTRILKSCSLLRSSMRSVTEIAGLVGYNTLSSYNRHFISAMGCTPTVWRRSSMSSLRPSLLTFRGWMEPESMESANPAEKA